MSSQLAWWPYVNCDQQPIKSFVYPLHLVHLCIKWKPYKWRRGWNRRRRSSCLGRWTNRENHQLNRILHRPQQIYSLQEPLPTLWPQRSIYRPFLSLSFNRETQLLHVQRSTWGVWTTCSQRWALTKRPKNKQCYCIMLERKPKMCSKLSPYQSWRVRVMNTELPSKHSTITSNLIGVLIITFISFVRNRKGLVIISPSPSSTFVFNCWHANVSSQIYTDLEIKRQIIQGKSAVRPGRKTIGKNLNLEGLLKASRWMETADERRSVAEGSSGSILSWITSQKLNLMKAVNTVEQLHATPWVSPNVVVPEPPRPKEIRICVDMQSLNQAITRERHVIPTIDDVVSDSMDVKSLVRLILIKGTTRSRSNLIRNNSRRCPLM